MEVRLCLCHLLGEILISPANFFFRRRKSFFASGIFFADKKYFRQRKKFCRRKLNFAGENQFSPAKKKFRRRKPIFAGEKKFRRRNPNFAGEKKNCLPKSSWFFLHHYGHITNETELGLMTRPTEQDNKYHQLH